MKKIILDPFPRQKKEIFTKSSLKNLYDKYKIIEFKRGDRFDFYNKEIYNVSYIIGQPKLEKTLLKKSKNLRAIFNVEGNFLQNIDYEYCSKNGINVLSPSSVFALPVAELAVGMMISMARNMHSSHVDFLNGKEKYGLDSNFKSEIVSRSNIGFIGFGDLGKSIKNLLLGFNPNFLVHDPWLPKTFLNKEGVIKSSFEEVMSKCRFVFVVAAVTETNKGMINSEKLNLMMPNAGIIILNRAAIANFNDLINYCNSGKIKLAVDVFPEEPLPTKHPLRSSKNILLSAHRAGALKEVLLEMGNYVMEDLELLDMGLPPVNCKQANTETVSKLRSNPVQKS